jgi:hypothetical protein
VNTIMKFDSIKGGDLLDQLTDYQFLKDSVPWSALVCQSVGVSVR